MARVKFEDSKEKQNKGGTEKYEREGEREGECCKVREMKEGVSGMFGRLKVL